MRANRWEISSWKKWIQFGAIEGVTASSAIAISWVLLAGVFNIVEGNYTAFARNSAREITVWNYISYFIFAPIGISLFLAPIGIIYGLVLSITMRYLSKKYSLAHRDLPIKYSSARVPGIIISLLPMLFFATTIDYLSVLQYPLPVIVDSFFFSLFLVFISLPLGILSGGMYCVIGSKAGTIVSAHRLHRVINSSLSYISATLVSIPLFLLLRLIFVILHGFGRYWNVGR